MDMGYNTVGTSMGAGFGRYAFIFKDPVKSNTSYVLDATNPLNITATDTHTRAADLTPADLTPAMKFKPKYYWGFTV
ncbi:hypothetical protein OS493_011213 [Desmophyllum pertusum]|uniref:Uncharacterized protein n=1 Tax=Desmophyllum pertusum TaxID=174260 RepID=A0A9W9Z1H1_9CNID|nr:hypothetical protein OS493_011213 [Desmophyllum pertusum]